MVIGKEIVIGTIKGIPMAVAIGTYKKRQKENKEKERIYKQAQQESEGTRARFLETLQEKLDEYYNKKDKPLIFETDCDE